MDTMTTLYGTTPLNHVNLAINDDGQLVRAGDVLPPEEGQALLGV